MEIRKKLGAKKAGNLSKSPLFSFFFRSDLNRPKDLAHPYKIDPYRKFFRNRSVFFGRRVDLSPGVYGAKSDPRAVGLSRHVSK